MRIEAIRRALAGRLGARYSDGLWEYLEERGFVEEVEIGAASLDTLAAEAQKLFDIFVGPKSRPAVPTASPAGPTPGQERAWALSQLVADHAAKDPDVVRFRDTHLPQGLIPWAEAESWIKQRTESDGPRTAELTVPVQMSRIERTPRGVTLNPPLQETRNIRLKVHSLAYARPDDTWVLRQPVVANGVLDQLRGLAESIASAYGWIPAQAAVFVLTGVPPYVETVRATVAYAKSRHDVDLAWACRIALDIDPAATPQEVLRAFQNVRREQGLARLRPLTPKHARLAAFAGAEHGAKPWAERLRLWNERFPRWKYSEERNFRRDALRAQARILYPGRLRGAARIRRQLGDEQA